MNWCWDEGRNRRGSTQVFYTTEGADESTCSLPSPSRYTNNVVAVVSTIKRSRTFLFSAVQEASVTPGRTTQEMSSYQG